MKTVKFLGIVVLLASLAFHLPAWSQQSQSPTAEKTWNHNVAQAQAQTAEIKSGARAISGKRPVSLEFAKKPISLGLVLDFSGSMKPIWDATNGFHADNLGLMQKLAADAINASSQNEYILTLVQNNPVRVVHEFTHDVTPIQRLASYLTYGTMTALHKSIVATLVEMAAAHNANKVMVVVTDGEDNSPGTWWEALPRVLNASGVHLYVIQVPGNFDLHRYNPICHGTLVDEVIVASPLEIDSKVDARCGRARTMALELSNSSVNLGSEMAYLWGTLANKAKGKVTVLETKDEVDFIRKVSDLFNQESR